MSPAAAAEAATRAIYQEIETESIEPSGLNPRTHWSERDDTDLVESVRSKGVMEPIIVRPHPTQLRRYQLVAGERRHRAAMVVGLGLMPAMVRDVTDEELLELALAENIQRRSMHPLDEANGFVKRLEMGKTTPEQLAATLGLSARYVRDRIRLKKLSKKAAAKLEAGAMTVSHAILLAKLDPKLQDEAIEDCESYELDFHAEGDKKSALPLGSLSELKQWINEHVPLDPMSEEAQEFPELMTEMHAAAAKGATVVMLSDQWQGRGKAKPGDPLNRSQWDECKKTDKAAQVGFIVDGHRRGTKVYWKPKAAPARRESDRVQDAAREKRESAARKREQEDAAFWNKNKAAALEAYTAHIEQAPIKVVISVFARSQGYKTADTAEAFLRGIVTHRAKNSLFSLNSFGYATDHSGFDVKKWLKTQKANAEAVHKLHPPAKKAKKR